MSWRVRNLKATRAIAEEVGKRELPRGRGPEMDQIGFFGKHFYRSDQPKTADGRPPRGGAHRNWTSRRKAKPDAENVPLARWVVLPSTYHPAL